MTWLSEENMGYRDGIRFLHNQEKSSSNSQDSFNNQVFGGLFVTFVFGRGEDKGILIHIRQIVNRLSDTPCVNKKEIKVILGSIVGNSWEAQAHLRSTSGPRWMYPHMYTHTWTFTLVFRHKELIELNLLFMYYVSTIFYLKDSFIYQIWFDIINVIFHNINVMKSLPQKLSDVHKPVTSRGQSRQVSLSEVGHITFHRLIKYLTCSLLRLEWKR